MSKRIKKILFEFASEFAQYHDEDEPDDPAYWWGHDTNLGDKSVAFRKAILAIGRIKRESMPIKSKTSPYKEISADKRKKLAEVIFGKKVPGYWHGSIGEYGVIEEIANVKGAFKEES